MAPYEPILSPRTPAKRKTFWCGICVCWAEAPIKIARMTLTIKLDGNWSSFQLANSAPPLSVTGSATAPSARITAILSMISIKTIFDYSCAACKSLIRTPRLSLRISQPAVIHYHHRCNSCKCGCCSLRLMQRQYKKSSLNFFSSLGL